MKREQDHLEENLQQFPRHELSEHDQQQIHDTLMRTRINRTDQKRKNRRSHKVVVGLTSMAALALFVMLGLSFFQDAFTKTADGEQPSEESGHSTTLHSSNKQDPDISNPDDDHNDGVSDKQDIEASSNKLIDALENRDMETVAHYVHPEKGLLFSPYVNVMADAVVFPKNEVSTMLDREEAFDWGRYDGKGTPIELTTAEYFDKFLDMTPYQNVDEILVNDMQDRGNTVNNIKDVFPDSQVIEYYNEGSEEYAGIDWSSVLLVYEKDETNAWQLVAIVRDMWTI